MFVKGPGPHATSAHTHTRDRGLPLVEPRALLYLRYELCVGPSPSPTIFRFRATTKRTRNRRYGFFMNRRPRRKPRGFPRGKTWAHRAGDPFFRKRGRTTVGRRARVRVRGVGGTRKNNESFASGKRKRAGSTATSPGTHSTATCSSGTLRHGGSQTCSPTRLRFFFFFYLFCHADGRH